MTSMIFLQKLRQYQAHYVTVTGGEPLAQKACINLTYSAYVMQVMKFRWKPAVL